ncbi:unnamed protein product [Nyctereutes procyonoides]|uniref:Complement component 1 Q subcomponent-binding protein, mitochondrial n=1 Tax=Nyctereutes procyonoides TaxID=34880 RepID=A0A811ZPV7_NYCPR|nr:unnamed protein product [Nyctereutes procyonoides]
MCPTCWAWPMPGLCATPTHPWPCMWPFGLLGVHMGRVRLWHPAHLGGQNFEFLNDEVKEEKKIRKHKSLPKMSGGWELEVNGTEAKLLQKKFAGEKITPTLNIPNSILPTFDGKEEPKVGEPEPELSSTPNFVVEVIKKGGKKTLVLTGLIFSIGEMSVQSIGVANTIAEELVMLSTALKHQEYINFLKDPRSFVKSQ